MPDEISRTITVKTEIQALKADFQVTKRQTVQQRCLVTGYFSDMYQEYRGEGSSFCADHRKVPDREHSCTFSGKEGVILDSTRTKALVSQLPPGQSVSLQAEIVIPEDIKAVN